MSTIKIPQNGLPQEIANIPFGQVIVLTDPNQGITSTSAQQIQAIISIAGKLKQTHKVYAIPVQHPELWGCFCCKVQTGKRVEILLSQKDSILEMLCEFWGLDYFETCKTIDISKRYNGYVSKVGDSHPVRVPITSTKESGEGVASEDYPVTLQCIRTYTKEGQLAKIEDVLEDSINHNLDIAFSDLVSLLEKVKARERKTYELKIDITEGKEGWDVTGKVWGTRRKCEISLIDSTGTPCTLKLEAQWIALYLTFIMFPDGIRLSDLMVDEEFYRVYRTICERLRGINNIPDMKTLEENVRGKRSKIKRAISDATNDDHLAQELFGIEGIAGEVFKVAGATNENRETIRKGFGLDKTDKA